MDTWVSQGNRPHYKLVLLNVLFSLVPLFIVYNFFNFHKLFNILFYLLFLFTEKYIVTFYLQVLQCSLIFVITHNATYNYYVIKSSILKWPCTLNHEKTYWFCTINSILLHWTHSLLIPKDVSWFYLGFDVL